MNTFELFVSIYGRKNKIFLYEYHMICKFFSMPRVEGWAKNGVWIYIPKESKGEGLNDILYAKTKAELCEKIEEK